MLAETGPDGPDEEMVELGVTALSGGGGELSRTIGDRFYVARTVENEAFEPSMALVLSTPTSQFEEAREDLYRVLFLVAMGAAALALALSAVAGERIGAGLRRLTVAATAIREGNLDVTADVHTDDELGTLGSTFDSMAGSIRTMTADLRTAAVEEAELRGRLEAVVAGMGEALVAVDADGRITDFNAAAEELCDLPAREARGRPVTEVLQVLAEDGSELTERLGRPVLEAWTEAGSVVQASGREVPVVMSAGTLRGPDNDVAGAVFVLRDVRRERELERMKTEFLANISHELRTPLTPIKGFASILQTRDLPRDRTQGFADEISVAADQMERVISQLVNFATIVGGRLTLDPQPIAVRGALDEVVARWTERAGATHQIVRRVSAGTPQVLADRTYLLQSLDELVDNAVKYSPGRRQGDAQRGALGCRCSPGADQRHRPGPRDPGRPAGVDLRRVQPGRRVRHPPLRRAWASAWRWCTGSPAPTAATSPASRCPARARASRSTSRPSRPRRSEPGGDRSLARPGARRAARRARGGVLGRRPRRGRGPPRGGRRGDRRAGRRRPRDRSTTAPTSASGDRVTMEEGVAVMRLRGGTTFELRKGLGDAASTAVLMADRRPCSRPATCSSPRPSPPRSRPTAPRSRSRRAPHASPARSG